MDMKILDKLDNLNWFIFESRKSSNLNDEDFSLQNDIKNSAFEMIEIYQNNWVKVTYNTLTNMNKHILVKVLNYNWFFDKSLSKKDREELKKIPII